MAGYSSTPLIKKLGIKDTSTLKLINIPSNYFKLLGINKSRLNIQNNTVSNIDFIHIFIKSKIELEILALLKSQIKKEGMIWISWPKKSANILTDINENIIRDEAIKQGLVDVKVCAIDEVWSGLKLIYKLKDR